MAASRGHRYWFIGTLLALVVTAGCVARRPAEPFRTPTTMDEDTIFAPMDWPKPDELRRGSGAPGNDYWQQRCDYHIEARLDAEAKRLDADMRITYHNDSPHALDFIWVQLEQNLFRTDSRGTLSRSAGGPMRRMNKSFDGGYELSYLRIAGRDSDYSIDDTLMYIKLPSTLQPGRSLEMELGFVFQMPPFLRRMGAQDVEQGRIFEYAQWFPHVCVYDDTYGWNTLNYLGTGEFYTNFGDYTVNLTVPRSYLVGATGTLLNPEEVLTQTQRDRLASARNSADTQFIRKPDEVGDPSSRPAGNGPLTWRYKAEDIRTFAWAASDAFIWDACGATIEDLDGSSRTVLCQSLYPQEAKVWGPDGEDGGSTQFIKHAIEFYSDFLYPYPYPQMTNVNGPEGGMEYPMIIFCGARTNPRGLMGVTDHEVGHNWFPMMVNNDERRHVWMDEGFNTFINRYSSTAFYGEDKRRRTGASNMVRGMQRVEQQPIVTYPDKIRGGRVGFLGYGKPGAGLVLLREYVLGHERFDRAFREYVRRWAFKAPRPWDFFRTMEDVAGEELSWFWRGWFYSTDTLDQSVIGVKPSDDGSAAIISLGNLQGLVMPVELEITYDDGSTSRRRIPVEAWYSRNEINHRLLLEGKRVTGVRLDPDGWLPDVEPRNNTWGRPK